MEKKNNIKRDKPFNKHWPSYYKDFLNFVKHNEHKKTKILYREDRVIINRVKSIFKFCISNNENKIK